MAENRKETTTHTKKSGKIIVIILGVLLCVIEFCILIPKITGVANEKSATEDEVVDIGEKIFTYNLGASMEPTMVNGDKYIVYPYDSNWVLYRTDIIGFYSEKYYDYGTGEDPEIAILRIIGRPGDVLDYDEMTGTFYRNGEPSTFLIEFDEFSYGIDDNFERDFDWGLGTVTVPENHFFVIGDNHKESVDSRHFGCISIDDIAFILRDTVYYAADDVTNTDVV